MLLDEVTLPRFARGAAILGAGGGGSTRTGLLAALQAVQEYGPVEVISVHEVPADGWILPVSYLGSTEVFAEKLGNARQGIWIRDMVERETGEAAFAMMPAEIGGANGLLPVAWAAHAGMPLVDADGMGRAFPGMQMVSMYLAGISATPTSIVDERGHQVVFRNMDAISMDVAARSATVAFGGYACAADHIMTGSQARGAVIENSISRALDVGALFADARPDDLDPALHALDGRALVSGKITDVERREVGGAASGDVFIEGLGSDSGRLIRLEVQNENLVALEDGVVLACVPDIITVLDSHTGEVVLTDLLRYGQRVTVVTLPAPPVWVSEAGLNLVGPRAFGYDFDYRPAVTPPASHRSVTV